MSSKTKVQSRCCRCLKLFSQSKMYEWWSDEYCPKCTKEGTRCERCNDLKPLTELKVMAHDISCVACIGVQPEAPTPDKKWYALSIMGSDAGVVRNIRRRFTNKGWLHRLGKIIIPRAKVVKTSSNKFEVYGGGHMVGVVYAADSEDALRQAKTKFERRPQGAWKPYDNGSPLLDPYQQIRRTVEKDPLTKRNKVVFEALAVSGKVLGRILGAKNATHAKTIAERLYAKPKTPNPREDVTTVPHVSHVKLVKHGGEKRVEARKAMAGYLLVNAEEDRDVLDELKKVRGVANVLPYRDKMTEKQIESFEQDHGPIPWSVPIGEKEVEEVIKAPLTKPCPTLDYKVGDQVRVIEGTWKDSLGKVVVIEGSPEAPAIVVQVPMMGRQINVRVLYNQLMKV